MTSILKLYKKIKNKKIGKGGKEICVTKAYMVNTMVEKGWLDVFHLILNKYIK